MNIYTDDWVNVKIINDHNPETFEIPTINELQDIKVGYNVKISNGIERFWVIIQEINKYYLIGKIDNKLFNNTNYDYGDLVMFEKHNIYDIHDFEFKHIMKKYLNKKNKDKNKSKSKVKDKK